MKKRYILIFIIVILAGLWFFVGHTKKTEAPADVPNANLGSKDTSQATNKPTAPNPIREEMGHVE